MSIPKNVLCLKEDAPMKITIKQVEEMISTIAGPLGIQVYKQLKNKEDVNEFLIAEKLKLPINQLRNIMYKFDNYNLISSTRKKDRKKGWYIYFWTFNLGKAKEIVVKLKKERIAFLTRKLEEEQGEDFFICPKKCTRLGYEEAMENNFKCTECGFLLEQEDNRKIINRMKKEIKELEQELSK